MQEDRRKMLVARSNYWELETEWKLVFKMYRVSFGEDEDILEIDVGDNFTIQCTYYHWIIHLKIVMMVNFIVFYDHTKKVGRKGQVISHLRKHFWHFLKMLKHEATYMSQQFHSLIYTKKKTYFHEKPLQQMFIVAVSIIPNSEKIPMPIYWLGIYP